MSSGARAAAAVAADVPLEHSMRVLRRQRLPLKFLARRRPKEREREGKKGRHGASARAEEVTRERRFLRFEVTN